MDDYTCCDWCGSEERTAVMVRATQPELAGGWLCVRCQEKEQRYQNFPPVSGGRFG